MRNQTFHNISSTQNNPPSQSDTHFMECEGKTNTPPHRTSNCEGPPIEMQSFLPHQQAAELLDLNFGPATIQPVPGIASLNIPQGFCNQDFPPTSELHRSFENTPRDQLPSSHNSSIPNKPLPLMSRLYNMVSGGVAQTTTAGQIQMMEAEIERLNAIVAVQNNAISRQEGEFAKVSHQLDRYKKAHTQTKHALDTLQETAEKQNGEKKALKQQLEFARREREEIIVQHQEESFQRMESAAWTPKDEEQVKQDLELLKDLMTQTAKDLAASQFPDMSKFSEVEEVAFSKFLELVIDGVGGVKIHEISDRKISGVVLNASLAHAVYTKIMTRPFFLMDSTKAGTGSLSKAYKLAQSGSEKAAHAWRAETLRMIDPPRTTNENPGADELRKWTQNARIESAHLHAQNFFMGPAKLFIDSKQLPHALQKIKIVFENAAQHSYQLWTRKTTMTCFTLADFQAQHVKFHPDSPVMTANKLVRVEDHEDQLEGNRIKMMVHPLLVAFGTDEGERYTESRTWIKADVWLPSSIDGDEEEL